MVPNHDNLIGGAYLSQDNMSDVCFTLEFALEAWLAYALDFQRDPNQGYFHLRYLLGNRANGSY